MGFYHLTDLNLIGKVDNFVPFLYEKKNGWVVDNQNLLMDRLMGYDGESIGSTSTLMLVEEITEEKANKLIKKLIG